MANVKLQADYHPEAFETYEWDIQLPDGYTADDIESFAVKWLQLIWVTMKDGTEHSFEKQGDHIYHEQTEDAEGYKWSTHERVMLNEDDYILVGE